MFDQHDLPIDPDPDPAPGGVELAMVAAVAIGGVAGAAGRHALAAAWPVRSGSFPWSTFVANGTGSLVLGVALVVFAAVWPDNARMRGLVNTGILGAFTTMSTFLVEVAVLGKDGRVGLAAVYLSVTVGVGVSAAVAGIRLGRIVESGRAVEAS